MSTKKLSDICRAGAVEGDPDATLKERRRKSPDHRWVGFEDKMCACGGNLLVHMQDSDDYNDFLRCVVCSSCKRSGGYALTNVGALRLWEHLDGDETRTQTKG